jgi:hypothetical protein
MPCPYMDASETARIAASLADGIRYGKHCYSFAAYD